MLIYGIKLHFRIFMYLCQLKEIGKICMDVLPRNKSNCDNCDFLVSEVTTFFTSNCIFTYHNMDVLLRNLAI